MKTRNLIILFRRIKTKTYERGEIIIETKSLQKDLFFIRKGLVRSFRNNIEGDEITFQLFPENQPFANAHAILLNEPSHFTYQALEKTKVYNIDYESFLEVTASNAQLLELNRNFLGKRILRQTFQRIETFVFLTPEERYKRYVKEHPNIINRAPDKYIAHVLGITPTSLSRIRNRIVSK